ncbi:hypothetical protein ILUMI_06068, partial [Ignelater luminosus]
LPPHEVKNNLNPFDFFNFCFDDDVIKELCHYFNVYATQYNRNSDISVTNEMIFGCSYSK